MYRLEALVGFRERIPSKSCLGVKKKKRAPHVRSSETLHRTSNPENRADTPPGSGKKRSSRRKREKGVEGGASSFAVGRSHLSTDHEHITF